MVLSIEQILGRRCELGLEESVIRIDRMDERGARPRAKDIREGVRVIQDTGMAAQDPVGGVEQLYGAVGVAAGDLDLAVWQDAQRRAPAGDLQGADRGKALARGVEELGGVEDRRAIDREAAGDQDLAALEENGPVGLTRNAKPPGEQGNAPRGRVVDLRGPLGVAARDQDAAVDEQSPAPARTTRMATSPARVARERRRRAWPRVVNGFLTEVSSWEPASRSQETASPGLEL